MLSILVPQLQLYLQLLVQFLTSCQYFYLACSFSSSLKFSSSSQLQLVVQLQLTALVWSSKLLFVASAHSFNFDISLAILRISCYTSYFLIYIFFLLSTKFYPIASQFQLMLEVMVICYSSQIFEQSLLIAKPSSQNFSLLQVSLPCLTIEMGLIPMVVA